MGVSFELFGGIKQGLSTLSGWNSNISQPRSSVNFLAYRNSGCSFPSLMEIRLTYEKLRTQPESRWFHKFLEHFLCKVPSLLDLFPENSSSLSLSKLKYLPSQLIETAVLCLVSHFLCCSPGTGARQKSEVIMRLLLLAFLL